MPWSYADYPQSLKHFPVHVREKAIDIANALLDEGYAEGSAIAIGTAQAKTWAANRDASVDDPVGADHGGNYHVVPHPRGWAVRRAYAERASVVFPDQAAARNRAIELAEGEGVDVILHNADGEIDSHIPLLSDDGETIEAAKQQPRGDVQTPLKNGLWDEIAGTWRQLTGEIRTRWGELSEADIDAVEGQRDRFIALLRERYGMTEASAVAEVETWERTRSRNQ